MKKRALVSAGMAVLAVVLLAVAGYAAGTQQDPNIQKRFKNQQERIDKGVASGQLTKDEAALVQDNLNRIMADEAQLRAAGKLTQMEKERLQNKLNQNSDMIYREKHNAIKRID